MSINLPILENKTDSNFDSLLGYMSFPRRRRKMHKYEVIVWWSEKDQAYIAEVPELPGCMSDGETYEEALKNIQLIISEWIDTAKELGREIPEPKGKLMYA